jgi:3-phenylpropionate/trans-cinnamate dioxygenase ferredoxin component
MSDYVVVGNAADLSSGTMKEYNVQGINVLVAKVGNVVYATQGRCPHMGGVLAEGKLDGTVVTCPRHASQFDLKDGHVVRWTSGEGLGYQVFKLLKSPRPLKTYETKVADGKIQVKLS